MYVSGIVMVVILLSAQGAPVADDASDDSDHGKKISPRQKSINVNQVSTDQSLDTSQNVAPKQDDITPIALPKDSATEDAIAHADEGHTVLDEGSVKKALRQFFDELRNYPTLVQEILTRSVYRELLRDPRLVEGDVAEVQGQQDNAPIAEPTWQYMPPFSPQANVGQQAIPEVVEELTAQGKTQQQQPQQQQPQQQQQEPHIPSEDQNQQQNLLAQPAQVQPSLSVVQPQQTQGQQQLQEQQQQQQSQKQVAPLDEKVVWIANADEAQPIPSDNSGSQADQAAYYVYPLQQPQAAGALPATQKVTLDDGSQVLVGAPASPKVEPAYYYYLYYELDDDDGETDAINPVKIEEVPTTGGNNNNDNNSDDNNQDDRKDNAGSVAVDVILPAAPQALKVTAPMEVEGGQDTREQVHPADGLNEEADLIQLRN